MTAAASTWDGARAREAIAEIVADAEAAVVDGAWPSHPLDEPTATPYSGLYLGAAGMLWALHRLGSTLELDVDLAARCRAGTNAEEDGPGLLFGEAGILAVTDPASPRLAELVAANERNPTWELLWGSPGTALAARAVGLQAAWERSAALLVEEWDRHARGLWVQEIHGKQAQYLGPPHGFAGNVHVLRGYLDEDELRRRVEQVLRAYAVSTEHGVNWPPLVGHEPNRTQWCHGAPGIVATLADLLPDDLLLPAAEHTWRTGPLEKGAGLCHGTAGNGYALLRTWSVTGDERWLDRARGFAASALEQVAEMRAHDGRGRYTLFTGDVGVALFAQACLDGDPRFPFLDVL